jgi:hypothetical protein
MSALPGTFVWARLVSNQRPLACEAAGYSGYPGGRNPHRQVKCGAVPQRRPTPRIARDCARSSGIRAEKATFCLAYEMGSRRLGHASNEDEASRLTQDQLGEVTTSEAEV